MLEFKVVYNDTIQVEELKKLLQDYEVEYFNDSIYKEKKLGYKVKNAFAAKKSPFVGVYKDGKHLKGFYSEAEECNIQTIAKWLDVNK